MDTLENYGITGRGAVLEIIKTYLSRWQQFVKVNLCESKKEYNI